MDVDRVEVGVARALAPERDRAAVGRPRGEALDPAARGQARDRSGGEILDVEVPIARDPAREGDRPAVGRPGRLDVGDAVPRQLDLRPAGGRHEVELEVAVARAGEGEPRAVGRPRRVPGSSPRAPDHEDPLVAGLVRVVVLDDQLAEDPFAAHPVGGEGELASVGRVGGVVDRDVAENVGALAGPVRAHRVDLESPEAILVVGDLPVVAHERRRGGSGGREGAGEDGGCHQAAAPGAGIHRCSLPRHPAEPRKEREGAEPGAPWTWLGVLPEVPARG